MEEIGWRWILVQGIQLPRVTLKTFLLFSAAQKIVIATKSL